MGLTIRGTVRKEGTRQGIADLIVEAYDADLFMDDLLGNDKTDNRGAFSIACADRSEFNDRPDVYLQVKTAKGCLLHSTRHNIIQDVTRDLDMDLSLAPAHPATGHKQP